MAQPLSMRYRLIDFFFFSSRRRHTRLVSDWSSDVCSSDLHQASHHHHQQDDLPHIPRGVSSHRGHRSEERRVGKECRSRWSPDHKKKKIENEQTAPTESSGGGTA